MPKNLISIIIFILVIIGFFYLGIPKYEKITSLNQQIEEVKINIQNKKDYFSKLNNANENLEKYNLFINKIDTALPNDPLILDLLKFLETKSSQNGLIFKDFKIEKISFLKERNAIQELSINISLSGSYSAFKNFLSELQYSERLIKISSFSLSLGKQEDKQKPLENYDFVLTIKTYSY